MYFAASCGKTAAERRMNLLTVQFKDLLYSLSASVAAGRQMGEALVEAEQNLAVMYEAKEPIMKSCVMRDQSGRK